MNGFGEKARSWRKGQKRAVSPIIATILLVAITVVLAAVLYILISGLTKGPGNTPLGTAFGFGTATPETGAAGTGCTGAADHCYNIGIASSSGVTTADLQFALKSATGGAVTTSFTVTLVSVTGTSLAIWTGQATSSASTTTSVSATQYLVLDTGTTSLSGAGDSFQAIATGGSYSGSVSVNLP